MKTTYEKELEKIDVFLTYIIEYTNKFNNESSTIIIQDFCTSFFQFLSEEKHKHSLHKQLRQARSFNKQYKKEIQELKETILDRDKNALDSTNKHT